MLQKAHKHKHQHTHTQTHTHTKLIIISSGLNDAEGMCIYIENVIKLHYIGAQCVALEAV